MSDKWEFLKASFPNIPLDTLHEVLTSCGGDPERATDELLKRGESQRQSTTTEAFSWPSSQYTSTIPTYTRSTKQRVHAPPSPSARFTSVEDKIRNPFKIRKSALKPKTSYTSNYSSPLTSNASMSNSSHNKPKQRSQPKRSSPAPRKSTQPRVYRFVNLAPQKPSSTKLNTGGSRTQPPKSSAKKRRFEPMYKIHFNTAELRNSQAETSRYVAQLNAKTAKLKEEAARLKAEKLKKAREAPPVVDVGSIVQLPRRKYIDIAQTNDEYTVDQKREVDTMLDCTDFYQVLKVTRNESAAEMKKKFRKAALHVHPDRNKAPGAAEAFKVLNQAYTTLTDPTMKREYDRLGSRPTVTATGVHNVEQELASFFKMFRTRFGA